MKTRVAQWVIALLLLALIGTNLAAQGVPIGDGDAYPAPPPTLVPEPYPWETTEPVNVYLTDPYPAPPSTLIAEPYPWPTTEPCLVTMHVPQSPGDARAQSAAAKPTVFVPSPGDIATARRYGEYAEARLLSDEGWWK